MYRRLFPFIFASIGFAMVVLARSMPLFEWQISEFDVDLPSTYNINSSPSPWVAHLGDSLDDNSFVSGKVSISVETQECIKDDLNITVNRSLRDKSFDQTWLNLHTNVSWLARWSWATVILSIIYIWWFVLWSKQGSLLQGFVLAGIALILFLNLTQILRLIAPFPFPSPYSFGAVRCAHGSITFSAVLLKIHYETIVILLVGILLELAVPLTMLYQISQVVIGRKLGSD